MSFSIIHLSDFHLRDRDNLNNKKIESLVSCLKALDSIEEIIIIISGDIANSGSINEYKVFSRLKRLLISSIKKQLSFSKFIRIFYVPGNHDLNYDDLPRKSHDIRNAYKKRNIDIIIDKEFSALDNYYSQLDNRYSVDINRIVTRRVVKLDCGFLVQLNLINTTPFSALEGDDKELHYFQDNDYSFIEKISDADLCLTVMHHPVDYFNLDTKYRLRDFIARNNHLLLSGHEHKDNIDQIYIDNSTGLYVSRAGKMEWSNPEYNDRFNIITVNTTSKELSVYSFIWDNEKEVFIKNKQLIDMKISKKGNKLIPLPGFIKEISVDDNILYKSITYDKFFVFPTLVQDNHDEHEATVKINSFTEFIELLNEKKRIWIKGSYYSGKTTLAKNIYNELLASKTPLLLRVSRNKVNLKNLKKTLFVEQYGYDTGDWNIYEQMDTSKKVLIIDDFDLIDNNTVKKNLLLYLENNFEYYIIISGNYNSYDIIDEVKEEVKEKYDETPVFCELFINPFYRSKRSLLVKNICKLNSITRESEVSNINKLIDSLVLNNSSLFTLKPNFIIQYTNFFLRDKQYESKQGEAIFSKIFEYNITSALLNYSSESEIDEITTAIEEISYYIHFNKKEAIRFEELESIIKEYNDSYLLQLNPRHIYEVLIKSNLFVEDTLTFSLYFKNKSYLSYFVARCLFRKFQSDGVFDDILYVLKNICFGINSDIILFISYLSNNTRIINAISSFAEELLQDLEEISFEKNNVKLLSNYGSIPPAKPNDEDVEKYNEHKEKVEEYAYERNEIEAKKIYEYDESKIDSFQYKFLRAVKYTEMLCKSLPAFNSIMKADQKRSLVDKIYSYPNRIVFSLIDPVSKNMEVIAEQIKAFADEIHEKYQTEKTLSKDEIIKMLSTRAQFLFLSCYDSFSELAVNKKTLDLLLSYKVSTVSQTFFRLSVLDNSGNTDLFFKEIEKFIKNHNTPNLIILARHMVRKHLICNHVPIRKKQMIIDKTWGKHARKQVLLSLPKEKE